MDGRKDDHHDDAWLIIEAVASVSVAVAIAVAVAVA